MSEYNQAELSRQAYDPGALAQAFLTFNEAAGLLQGSYHELQAEVIRLRQEAEVANSHLSSSLQINIRLRGFLSRILQSLPCGVLVIDENGFCKVANTAAQQILGMIPIGEPLPGPLRKIVTTLSVGAPEQTIAIDIEGNAKELACRRGALLDPDTHNADTIVIVQDVTLQQRLKREAEQAQRVRALADVSTVLAHEIRNPLGSLELFASLISDAVSGGSEAHQWSLHLQAGIRMLSATVNNVLEFHGEGALHGQTVALDRLFAEMADFLKPLSEQYGIEVSWTNEVGQVDLQVEPNQLQQVFFNLALNAFLAMQPGGKLQVRAYRGEDNKLAIDFQDNGVGIAEAELQKIFAAGYSTKGTTGLGLSVCKRIVERHNGNIEVSSKVGKGTMFTLNFKVTGAVNDADLGC